jgi:hypothetical protein
LLLLAPVGAGFAAWVLTGVIAVLLAAMCAAEAREGESERLPGTSQG